MEEAEKTKYMTVCKHEKTRFYHGCVYYNHPTPSGIDRHLLAISTTQGFETEFEAGEFMNNNFPELDPIELKRLSKKNNFKNMPEFKSGQNIVLLSYNHFSKNPESKRKLPIIGIYENQAWKKIKLGIEQLRILKAQGKIEIDTVNDDPELSCVYTTYVVV